MLAAVENVKKEGRISLRVAKVVEEALAYIAQKKNRSLNNETERILTKYLTEYAQKRGVVFLYFTLKVAKEFLELVSRDMKEKFEKIDKFKQRTFALLIDEWKNESGHGFKTFSALVTYSILRPEKNEEKIAWQIASFLENENINPFEVQPGLYHYIENLDASFYLYKLENLKNTIQKIMNEKNKYRFDVSLKDLITGKEKEAKDELNVYCVEFIDDLLNILAIQR